MKKGDLLSLKGGAKPNVFKDELKAFIGGMAGHIEYLKVDAKLRKTKYDALLKENFTKEQALELTKGPF